MLSHLIRASDFISQIDRGWGEGWKSQKLNFNRNLLQRSPDTVSVCVNFVSFAPANENLFWFFVVEIFLLFSFFFQKEREKMSP
jgi:hypothetical protein